MFVKYRLTRLRLNNKLKDYFGIESRGYPFIIVPDDFEIVECY